MAVVAGIQSARRRSIARASSRLLCFASSRVRLIVARSSYAFVLDEGALVRNGSIKLIKPLAELKIPPTVQGILAARIERLSEFHDVTQRLLELDLCWLDITTVTDL